jgi:hypothetical protein
MRLEKERGKGEPPVVVPNNMVRNKACGLAPLILLVQVLYFGYERFWFEPTKVCTQSEPSSGI